MTQPVSPSGTSWTLTAGEYTAVVVSVGGGLRAMSYAGRDVLVGYGEDEPCDAGIGQHLFPWPNRIADGRYTFAGTEQQLALTEPDRHTAIHGLTRWVAWSRTDDGSDPATATLTYRLHGEPGYPHQLDLSLVYALDAGRGLTVTAAAVNVGADGAPYGFGTHPYLTVGRPLDECELTFTAAERMDVDPDRLLPRGMVAVAGSAFDFTAPRVVGDLFIDNAFTGLPAEWSVGLRDPGSGRTATLSSDEPWLQLYSGDTVGRAGLAVEPMTCPPNAFATGDGVIVLAPGDTHTSSFTIAAG